MLLYLSQSSQRKRKGSSDNSSSPVKRMVDSNIILQPQSPVTLALDQLAHENATAGTVSSADNLAVTTAKDGDEFTLR